MKILMAGSECDPYIKVGGLGDVISSLSVALRSIGHDVRIVLPKYRSIDFVSECRPIDGPMIINMGYGIEFAKLIVTEYKNVLIYFIEFDKYFDRSGVYGESGNSYDDNWQRFGFFCRAVVDMCQFLGWPPDVIHCNDWPTGIIPAILTTNFKPKILEKTKTVYTIHNMAHHGYAPKEILKFVGLYDHFWHPFAMEACGSINVMKGALQFSHKITTVSNTYAEEIKTSEFGCGLDDVLRYRAQDLVGICNGIDTEVWNPKTDLFLPKNFSVKSLKNKDVCKSRLQQEMGLCENKNIPIFGVISRFFWQKGLDILADILPDIFENMVVQFVILGSGDPALEDRFKDLRDRFPESLGLKIGYDCALSHMIESGSDFFVMPSRYEPCGLNQMYSMRYGTLPIVRATGGLIDTVENYNEQTGTGTGFVFEHLTKSALYNTVGWACATYYDKKEHIEMMRKSAMNTDFSWEKSAKKYEDIYLSMMK